MEKYKASLSRHNKKMGDIDQAVPPLLQRFNWPKAAKHFDIRSGHLSQLSHSQDHSEEHSVPNQGDPRFRWLDRMVAHIQHQDFDSFLSLQEACLKNMVLLPRKGFPCG